MALELNDILDGASKVGASDVHMMEDEVPHLRIDGILRPVKSEPLDHDRVAYYLKSMMPAMLEPVLAENRGVDFAYRYGKKERYRVNAFHERNRLKLVMRSIPIEVPTIESLDLPDTLKRLALQKRGMILVTGATGSGKSTSLAAMVQYVNVTKPCCIVTIEDPIEFMYDSEKALVAQREVGVDVPDYHTGLVQSLRQDPDIILIGEMRHVETMRVCITAAETGHLVMSTLHTTNAVQTIERIVSTFPEEERDLTREQLSFNLAGAVTQRLLRRAGNKGRIAALEIMVVNATIEKLIYENRIREIVGCIAGREDGMTTFDQSLADLVRAKKVNQDEAERTCDDVYALRRFIKGITSTGESGGIIAGFGG